MPQNKEVINSLLDSILKRVLDQQQSCQNDLVRSVGVLNDATKSLLSNFTQLYAESGDAQKKVLQSCVRDLQFDDIVQQILYGVQHRSELLQDSLNLIQDELGNIGDLSDAEKIEQLLHTCEALFETYENKLTVESTVRQDSMKAGEIDLF